jgi:hypothetical protein
MQRGGRPSNASKLNLIAFLAMDWFQATGNEPKPGRGSNTGFGALVYLVFEWLDLLDQDDASDESGLHVLRQYWEAVEEGTRDGPESAADEAQGK